ncbi:MAG: hypothetical protein ACYCW6_00255 [Candidatus Xenobia bacterium]
MNAVMTPPEDKIRVRCSAVNLLAELIEQAERRNDLRTANNLRRIARDVEVREFPGPCPIDAMTTLMEAVADTESIAYRETPCVGGGGGGRRNGALARAYDKLASAETYIMRVLRSQYGHLLERLGRDLPVLPEDAADDIAVFLDECTMRSAVLCVPQADLYLLYVRWCSSEAREVVTKRRFGGWLLKHGYKRGRNMDYRFWVGIGITSLTAGLKVDLTNGDGSRESSTNSKDALEQ